MITRRRFLQGLVAGGAVVAAPKIFIDLAANTWNKNRTIINPAYVDATHEEMPWFTDDSTFYIDREGNIKPLRSPNYFNNFDPSKSPGYFVAESGISVKVDPTPRAFLYPRRFSLNKETGIFEQVPQFIKA